MEQVYTPTKDYKVLVRCFTYNQSKYIEDALNGFAMQKTDFPFVCLVMDDASTDGEQDVIKAWMERECDMAKVKNVEIEKSFITIIPHKTNSSCTFAFYFLKENLYKKGGKMFMVTPWREHCEYEALCEGDDYWNKSDKLSRQVGILENNPRLSSCWSGYDSYQNGKLVSVNVYPRIGDGEYSIFTIDDWADKWFTKTLTSLFRHSALSEYSIVIKNYNYARDIHLCYYLLKWGPAAYIHESMGIYNIHEGGICSMVAKHQNAIHSYNCYKELYLEEHNDVLRKHYLYSINKRLVYPSKSSSRLELFIEGTKLCRNFIDQCRLFYHYIFSYTHKSQ